MRGLSIWNDETKIFRSDSVKYVRINIGEEFHSDYIKTTMQQPVIVLI